jgi:hypothetical protein
LENTQITYDKWLKIEDRNELSLANELFFEFFKAQIYLSAGWEDLALNNYFNCKGYGDKLPLSNPDKALPFCGLGSAFSRIDQVELALRCFLKVFL